MQTPIMTFKERQELYPNFFPIFKVRNKQDTATQLEIYRQTACKCGCNVWNREHNEMYTSPEETLKKHED